MTTVIGVRFKTSGRIYYFDPTGFTIEENDGVIVETARGQAKPAAKAFVAFLKSPQGAKIFEKWGWHNPAH